MNQIKLKVNNFFNKAFANQWDTYLLLACLQEYYKDNEEQVEQLTNHILESLSCEIPTYVHKDGGGAVEFAGIENTYSDIYELVERVKGNYDTFNTNSIQ